MKNNIALKLSIFLVLTFTNHMSSAQSGTVTTGGQFNSVGGSVSFSIGQLDYVTLNNSTIVITQGLQQPFELFLEKLTSRNNKDSSERISAFIFPNPTNEYLVISIEESNTKEIMYSLVDASGRTLLSRTKINDNTTNINMQDYPDGTYYLLLINRDDLINQFIINKIK